MPPTDDPLPFWIDRDALHVGEHFSLSLQRTLRIPDDGHDSPLPPGLGRFPIRAAAPDDDADLLVPLHQCEALWLSFDATVPHAVKVGVGGIDALTGRKFVSGRLALRPQDHLVAPEQPWLDGINAGDGFIRQFVAVPLGGGQTVEGQLTAAERRGSLQLLVVPPKPGAIRPAPPLHACAAAAAPMGLAAGGRMRQEIARDRHGLGVWDMRRATVVEIGLCNSEDWREVTGEDPPPTPISAETYSSHGLPWFELYSERGDIAPSPELAGVHSLAEQPVSTERLACTAPVRETFDHTEDVFGGEGFVVYAGDRGGVPYVVVDEGTMADFLVDTDDAHLLDGLVAVHRFASRAARERWIGAERRRFAERAAGSRDARHIVDAIDRWLERSRSA